MTIPNPSASSIPGHVQSLQTPKPQPHHVSQHSLSTATADNRHVSPSSASASSAGEASGRKMKRTAAKVNVKPSAYLQAPSWATSLLKSKPSTSPAASPSAHGNSLSAQELPNLPPPSESPLVESPEPVRITSDIPLPQVGSKANSSPKPSDDDMGKTSLAQNARIQALQQSWMATNSGPAVGGTTGNVSSPAESVDGPKDWLGGALRKRTLEASEGGDAKRRNTNSTGKQDAPKSSSTSSVAKDPPSSEADQPSAASIGKSRRSQSRVSRATAAETIPGFIPIKRTTEVVQSSDEATDDVSSDDAEEDSTEEDELAPDEPQSVYISKQREAPRGILTRGIPDHFHTAKDSSRLYSQHNSLENGTEPACGALVPTGYKRWTDPDYPYICPARHCRLTFQTIHGLGTHFAMKHNNTKFNDNLNGTLTVVGYYEVPGQKRSPAIVVSRNPPTGNEPPMPEPEPAGYKLAGQTLSRTSSTPKSRVVTLSMPRSHSNPSPPVSGAEGDSDYNAVLKRELSLLRRNREPPAPKDTPLMTYLVAHLPANYRLATERPDFRVLLKLPMKRSFPDSWGLRNRVSLTIPPLAGLSLLMFLTGDLAPTPCSTCANEPTASGSDTILRPCVVMSAAVPSWLKETTNQACACCQWRSSAKRCKNTCNFLTAPKAAPGTSSLPAPVTSAAESPIESPVPLPRAAYPSRPSIKEATGDSRPSSPPRRITRHTQVASKASVESDVPAVASVPVSSTPDQTMPAEMLEMEDWEVAPGRVRDEQSEIPTNVAFSNAYLTSNQAVTVSEDIAFNVLVIKPGASHQWTEEEDKVRICSLAVGKVNVNLGKTEPFQIGPNGMFKLKPGVACLIENRMYIDAVVHVTSVMRY
ncbi:uncharacterized protein CTRU02_201078 [Colletotrichum truncatum]|uniref:Uncharacterized protein n=1 Tax=Colletotrichum truncatum TaxID=5467 RepID=A0ACC3ZGY6_COLTU|nr:uncharacterized protein CTRU02_12392 [Colletotrichum truncatum]KAF6784687.1 hypothetical protein CTRU02_12392 [Colletotrichum truncatum]